MALNTGALKKDYGTTVNHVQNGAAVNDGADSSGETIDNAFSNTDEYSFCDVALTLDYASAPSAGNDGVTLYKRRLDVVSTNDEGVWERVANKEVDDVATEQYILFEMIPVWKEGAEFMFANDAGQQVAANWDLDVYPWTWNTQA